MRDEIEDQLNYIEDEHNVEILNARQRGSRMLGIEHDESDYDVMFLFAHPIKEYLSLDKETDNIERHHVGPDDKIDLMGWDVYKFARLASNSNPNAVEYCAPSRTYRHAGPQFVEVRDNVLENANLMALYHHYLSMAKSNYSKYVEPYYTSPVTRQVHVARAVCMAEYIRENDSVPPIEVPVLLDIHRTDATRRLSRLLPTRQDDPEREIEDRVGTLLATEERAAMEPTDERTKNPSKHTLEWFVQDAIHK